MAELQTIRSDLGSLSVAATVAGLLVMQSVVAPSIFDRNANSPYVGFVTTEDTFVSPFYAIPEDLTVYSSSPSVDLQARTELGRKLLEHRRKVVAGGLKLLSFDEINAEVKILRGERS